VDVSSRHTESEPPVNDSQPSSGQGDGAEPRFSPAFVRTEARLIEQLRAARTTAASLVAASPLHESCFASDIRARIVDLLDDVAAAAEGDDSPKCACCAARGGLEVPRETVAV
jgi:hypothetical protein